MRRRAGAIKRFVMAGLIALCAVAAAAYLSSSALAQAGSAGGSLGKKNKSASGGEPSEPAARKKASRAKPKTEASENASREGAKCGRIVGTWHWFNNLDVAFKGDGTGSATNGDTSSWTCDGGMYTVTWHFFGNVDRLTVSSNGKEISGTGIMGIQVSATRK